ncbi:hypothetical protein D3C76_829970 [compost metagenome]
MKGLEGQCHVNLRHLRLEHGQQVEARIARAKIVDGSNETLALVLHENRFEVLRVYHLLASMLSTCPDTG